jgi:hypothetical protein
MTVGTATVHIPSKVRISDTATVPRSDDYSSHLSLHTICHSLGTHHYIELPRRVMLRCADY